MLMTMLSDGWGDCVCTNGFGNTVVRVDAPGKQLITSIITRECCELRECHLRV